MFGFFSNLLGSNNHNDPALNQALQNSPYLLDVRSPLEFAQGSVSNAVNIPLEQLPARWPELSKQPNIVVFCRSGNRSGQAKTFLEQQGAKQVLNGGSWENVQQHLDRLKSK